jgi:hypothetical protein
MRTKTILSNKNKTKISHLLSWKNNHKNFDKLNQNAQPQHEQI